MVLLDLGGLINLPLLLTLLGRKFEEIQYFLTCKQERRCRDGGDGQGEEEVEGGGGELGGEDGGGDATHPRSAPQDKALVAILWNMSHS